MDVATHAGLSEPRSDGRRPEPRWMTLTDVGVIVAGVALVMTIPSRAGGWAPFLPPPPLLFFAAIGSLRVAVGVGLVLAGVVLFRRWRYGGAVGGAEGLALGLASLGLLNAVPNLDEAVNAYYATVGSAALDFGVARWLLSAPAAAGVILIAAGLVLLRHRVRNGSRGASALTVVGIVGALFLWFWGPCEVARLQLPWLLVPSPPGNPSSWGWRGVVTLALREVVANGPMGLTWGLPAVATVRSWWRDRHRGRARAWVWTEPVAVADALAVFLLITLTGTTGHTDVVSWVSWLASVGLASWWITGRLAIGRNPVHPERPFADGNGTIDRSP